MRKYIKIFFTLSFFLLIINNSYSQPQSVFYRNFVKHSEGDQCRHIPPVTSFTAYLNNDQSKILIENAPRWTIGGDPNIDGNGTFGVELGNFNNPAIQVGDSVFMRFTCNELGQQAVLQGYITNIPFVYFPVILNLYPKNIPAPPQGLSLIIDINRNRILQWTQEPGVLYSVYRRSVKDTIYTGKPRMLYSRIAQDIAGNSYTDTTQSLEGHGYIIISKLNGIYGSHSNEVVDFPGIPSEINAAVAYSNPFKVAVTWQHPGGIPPVIYRIYRSQNSGFYPDSSTYIGESTGIAYLDENVIQGQTYYYSVIAVNIIGIEGEPSDEVSVTVVKFAGGLPDLDVLFISRTPRYNRFDIVYDPPGYNPHPRPGTENDKHYPDSGESITFSVVIRNSGGGTIDGFDLNWYMDSVLVQTETYGIFYPQQRIKSKHIWNWETTGKYFRVELVPYQTITEVSTQNNSLRIRSNALSFHFYAEENILELFGNNLNPMNSYGFEDWAQVQIKKWNQFLAQAVYPPFTPNGVPEAVFLDTVSYFANGGLPVTGTHAPVELDWDGAWGFTGDQNAINYFQNIVLGQNSGMDWALLHELGHQLGLIDIYNQDVNIPQLLVIEPRTGQRPALTPIAWDVLYYSSRKDFLMHSNYQAGLSDHSAGGLLRNLSKRRGYFGDYLADIPADNSFLLKRQDGSLVRNAEIWVYQKQDGKIPDIPKFRGFTDSNGVYTFPHVTDTLYHGGITAKNPFSTQNWPDPHVVGTEATLFIRVANDDSVGYVFTDICYFNVAYWSGNTTQATYELTVKDWFNLPANGISDDQNIVPLKYELYQNFPNPFNPSTKIKYQLSGQTHVKLDIFNTIGQKIHTLVNTKQIPGFYMIEWDGKDNAGKQAASGIYMYRMETEEFTKVKKMILLR